MMNDNDIPGVRRFVSRHDTRCAADMLSIDLVYKTAEAANAIGNLDKGLHVEVIFTDFNGKTVKSGDEDKAEFAMVYLISA